MNITRRGFLTGTAGIAAAAACGLSVKPAEPVPAKNASMTWVQTDNYAGWVRGDFVYPSAPNGYVYVCTESGCPGEWETKKINAIADSVWGVE